MLHGISVGLSHITLQYFPFILCDEQINFLGPSENWGICEDGSLQPRAVRGAVEDFAKSQHLSIVTSQESFPTWFIQKPYDYVDVSSSSSSSSTQ